MRYKDYIEIANKYEVKSFIDNDSIQFCYQYKDKKDIEIAGIISSWLSYGIYDRYMNKIRYILFTIMNDSPYEYIMDGKWNIYKDNYHCLYKIITWHNFAMLCDKLRLIYLNNKDLEEATLKHFIDRNTKFKYYHQSLCDLLSGESMIPTSRSLSSNKRMNMFLRWMIREDSLVDLGIWNQFKQKNLLVSCDVNTMEIAKELNIIYYTDETLSLTIKLTDYAKKVFPDDPSRMDFALYGYGINKLK